MNFLALIGIAQNVKIINNQYSEVEMKVEKNFVENNEDDWYEIINVLFNNEVFKYDLKNVVDGSIIGIKGRISPQNQEMKIIGERLQVF